MSSEGENRSNLSENGDFPGDNFGDNRNSGCHPVVTQRQDQKPPKLNENAGFEVGGDNGDKGDNLFLSFWDDVGAGVADRTETAEGDNDGWWDPFEDDEDEAPF